MAIHAADQAVLAVALTVEHGGIALVHQEFHVLAAHHLHWLDAGNGIDRLWRLRDDDIAKARALHVSRERRCKPAEQGREQ